MNTKRERFATCTKQGLVMLLMLTLVVCFSAQPAAAKAAPKSKGKLSRKSVTLTVGKCTTLKLNGTKKKAKWKVAGKKLITIKTKGKKRHKAVIKAGKTPGTCTIKVKAGKRVYTCKVKVKKPVVADSFVRAMTNTSVKLLQQTAGSKENLLLSPDSILSAMVMTENGAAGATRTEMEKAFGASLQNCNQGLFALHQRLTERKEVGYHLADAIWYRQGAVSVKDSFRDSVNRYFQAEIRGGAFDQGTVEEINNWVKENTKGMIPSIIDRLDAQSRVALLNAIAFEAKWADQYSDRAVYREAFKNADGSSSTVNMLRGGEHCFVEMAGGTGFVKEYEGGALAFLGLLPPEGMSVDTYISKLSGGEFLAGWQSRLQGGVQVDTKLPEFSYDYSVELKGTLQQMGIRQAFGAGADFSGMADSSVFIDQVIHKTHIELDRNGTKAAAATAVLAKATAVFPTKTYKVYLNRPFVYAIVDRKTGIPLFIGAVKKL